MMIRFRGKNFWVGAKETNFLTRVSGLMFRTSKTENLLFDFGREGRHAIHSFFVFFSFLAVWLDKENKVVECKMVKPFCSYVLPSKPFRKLVEIPINRKNNKILSYF